MFGELFVLVGKFAVRRQWGGGKEALACAVINWSFSPAACGPGRPGGIGHWVGLGALPAAYVLSTAGHRERTLENHGLASSSTSSRVHGDRQQLPQPTDVHKFPPAHGLASRGDSSQVARA